MIKSKFCFFQMQIKGMFRNAIEFCQAPFCKTPERFDAVNMPFATGKLVVAKINPEVLIKTDIDQSVIAAPPIRMNDSIWCNMPTDNSLQCGFGAIRKNLCVYFHLALQNTKNNRFAMSASTSFTSDALRTKIRLIDFYSTLKRRFKFATLSYSLPDFEANGIDRSYRNIGQLRSTSSSKIQSKTANKLLEFSFSNSRTKIVSVFNSVR